MLQLTLVAIGVGSLVARSDAVFNALRLIGAAYLVLLGIRKIRERKSLAEFGAAAATPRSLAPDRPRGLLRRRHQPQGPDHLHRRCCRSSSTARRATSRCSWRCSESICIVIALLSDGAWAFASGTAREWLGSSPRRLERLTAGGGVALIGLGVGLAITGRKH